MSELSNHGVEIQDTSTLKAIAQFICSDDRYMAQIAVDCLINCGGCAGAEILNETLNGESVIHREAALGMRRLQK